MMPSSRLIVNNEMKLSCKFTAVSLISLTFCLLACTSDKIGNNSTKPTKKISLEDYASIADSTLHKNVKMYRALNFKGDTTQWDESDCNIKDTSFSCYHETCVGCYTVKICRDANNKRIKCPSYKDTIYDTTYKNINFGENALVNYIPIAKIPKFNRDTVQKVLSTRLYTATHALNFLNSPPIMTLNPSVYLKVFLLKTETPSPLVMKQ